MPIVGFRIKKGNLPASTVFEDDANLFLQVQKVKNTSANLLTVYRGGVSANTSVAGIDISLDNLAAAEKIYAQFLGAIEDSTTSSEKGQIIMRLLHTGALRNALKINNDGTIEWGTPTTPFGKFSAAGLTALRTFTFPDADSQLVGLAAANTFTAAQKIQTTGVAPLTLYRTGITIGGGLYTAYNAPDSAAAEKNYGRLTFNILDNTAGSEDSEFVISTMLAGVVSTAFRITGGTDIHLGTPGLLRLRLSEAGLTANRTFTFPNVTTQLAGLASANTFTLAQKVSVDVANLLTLYRPSNLAGLTVSYDLNNSVDTEKTFARIDVNIRSATAGAENTEYIVRMLAGGVLGAGITLDETGLFKIGVPNVQRVRLDCATGLTAIRTYTFPNATTKFAGTTFDNVFTSAQTIAETGQEQVLVLRRDDNTVGTRIGHRFTQLASDSSAVTTGLVLCELMDNTLGAVSGNVEIWSRSAGTLRQLGNFSGVDGIFRCGGLNRRVGFSETGLTAQHTYTLPNVDAQLDGVANTVTLSHKTLDSTCNVSAAVGGGGGGGGGGALMPIYNFVIRKSGANYIGLNMFTEIESSDTNLSTLLGAILFDNCHVHFGPGDFSLTTLWTMIKNNVTISGAGVDVTRILLDTATTPNATSIRVGTTALGTAHTLSSDAVLGQRVIVAGSTTGVTAGDWIFITSDKLVDASSLTRKYAEFHKVLSVDSSTNITIEDNLMVDFTTTDLAAYYVVPWTKNFTLEDLTIYDNRGDNNVATAGDGPFHLVMCYKPHFNNVKLEAMAHDCLRVESCWEPILTNVYCETPVSVLDDPDHEYGIYVTGATTNFEWNGGWGNRCRHTITNNTNSGGVYRRGLQRNGTLNGVSSFNSNVANFDLHQCGLGWTFNGCIALAGQHETVSVDVQGFNLRSPATLNGCVVQGATHESIVVWMDADAVGDEFRPGGSRTSIIGCQIISPLQDDVDTERRGIVVEVHRGSVLIEGNQFFDIADEAIVLEDDNNDITITGNMFHSCGATLSNVQGLISCFGSVDRLTVTENDFCAGTPSAAGVPLMVTTSVDQLVFKDNQVGALTNKLPIIPAASTDVRIQDNPGLNPINKITNHTNATLHTIGLYGGSTSAVVASTDYIIVGSGVLMTSTGGTGVSITLKDGAGNTVAASLTTLAAQFLPLGYKINFGAFSVAPTVTVFAV